MFAVMKAGAVPFLIRRQYGELVSALNMVRWPRRWLSSVSDRSGSRALFRPSWLPRMMFASSASTTTTSCNKIKHGQSADEAILKCTTCALRSEK